MSKFAGAWETTVVFLFFLFLWMWGAMLALKYIVGPVITPSIHSLGTVAQAA